VGLLIPIAFSAFTVKLYGVFVVSPVMLNVPLPAPVRITVAVSGHDVATYLKMGDPPLFVGAVNVTVAVVAPVAVAITMVGGSGTVCPFVINGNKTIRK
jgi:hypothetical protein